MAGAVRLALAWVPAGRATSDSAWYLEGARHLARGLGYTTAYVPFGETQLRAIAEFAPGFPLLTVPGIWLGLDARHSAALVLALSYVGYVVATYLLLLEATRTRWWPAALGLTAVLAIHPGVLDALDTIGSDLPSAAFWTFAVYFGVRLLHRRDLSTCAIIGVGVWLGLALLIRWAALYSLIAFWAAWFVSLPEHFTIRRRAQLTAWIAAAPIGLVGPWLIRNRLLAHTLTGGRRIVVGNPYEVTTAALQGLTADVFPFNAFFAGRGASSWVYGFGVCVAAAVILVSCRRVWSVRSLRLLLVAAAGIVALLIVSASVHPIDPLDVKRFWLPAWPLIAAAALGTLARADPHSWARGILGGAFVLSVLITGVQFVDQFRTKLPHAAVGRGFLDRSWVESVAIQYALHQLPECVVLSNDPRVLVIQGEVGPISDLPIAPEKLLPLLSSGRRVCIAYLIKETTERVERQRRDQQQLLRAMAERQLIRRVRHDDVAEVWVSCNDEVDVPGCAPMRE